MRLAHTTPTLTLRDVEIPAGRWRNFRGEGGEYNQEGDRNFTVFLTPEVAEAMLEDGWNVKYRKPKDDPEEPDAPTTPYLKVKVGYKYRPPVIELILSGNRLALGQHELEVLDWADIERADMIIRPYHWNKGGRSGITAYVQELYVTLHVSELAQEYQELPEMSRESRPALAGSEPLELEAGDEGIVDAEIVEDED